VGPGEGVEVSVLDVSLQVLPEAEAARAGGGTHLTGSVEHSLTLYTPGTQIHHHHCITMTTQPYTHHTWNRFVF